MERFSKEHRLFREALKAFIEREINPYVELWEAKGSLPARELYQKLGHEGYLGLTYPEKYGGLALDLWYKVIWLEEVGRIPAGGITMSITLQSEICTPAIEKYGSPELKARFLLPAVLGNAIGALAITERKAGSDVASITTVAEEDGDDYIINGEKSYITNGGIADFVVTLCRTDQRGGTKGMSLIVVPTDIPGFTVTEQYPHKLGNLSCDHAALRYQKVRVPKKYVIGRQGYGWDMQMEQFQNERLVEAILLYSQAKSILDKTKAYAKERIVLGRPLIEHQSIAFRLVDMETELELLRRMNYYTVQLTMKGQECNKEVTMAKLKGGQLIRQVADECLHLFGAHGYLENKQISRALRDSRASALTGGSIEVMQHILTKFL